MILRFDFTQDATRRSILDQLKAKLPDQTKQELEQQVASLRIPDRHHRDYADIAHTIGHLDVPQGVAAQMLGVYRTLTHAEAFVHQTAFDQAHFHEVGRPGGIRNVAAICLAYHALSPEWVVATPVQPGSGTVDCAHGTMPVPAPATAVILDSGIPTCANVLEGELVTPTSAAMIKCLVDEFVAVDQDGNPIEVPSVAPKFFKGHVPDGSSDHGHGHHHGHGHDHGHDRHHGHSHGHHHHHHEHEQEGEAPLEKRDALLACLSQYEGVAVAFSGGVDSSLLLKAAKDALGDNVVAITARSCFIPQSEIDQAHQLCHQLGVAHAIVDFKPLEDESIVANPENRCYICKHAIMSGLLDAVSRDYPGYVLVDGSNVSDRSDYRPGSQALEELGILSPLNDCGLAKKDIRALARHFGLDVWNKPSAACLASRVPYGTKLDAEVLARIERAEALLVRAGLGNVRVRVHEDASLARIEVGLDSIDEALHQLAHHGLADELKGFGFRQITLDMLGYRMAGLQ